MDIEVHSSHSPADTRSTTARRVTAIIRMLAIWFPFSLLVASVPAEGQNPVARYNVTWNSPSQDSSGSMPLGNGDIGVNVWVEQNGDLVFYIGKTDAWSETARLLKLGRVRVRFSPNPFVAGQTFNQTLHLDKGEITIDGGTPENPIHMSLWVDANVSAIQFSAETKKNTEMQVLYERWRDQQRVLEGQEAQSAYGLDEGPEPVISSGDSLQLDAENRVVWYHRNSKSAYASIMRHQGLEELIPAIADPLQNRTFGASIHGDGLVNMTAAALHSKESTKKHSFSVYPLTTTAASGEEFIAELRNLSLRIAAMKMDDRRIAHDRWWDEFWNRSWIRISGSPEAEKVSQAYALQRFVNACAGRGAQPIKFNGSIFNVDAKEKDDATFDADYRRWGGPYWFQNTRLIYWPMLASGDFEMMQPFFKMYFDDRLLAERRTRTYFNHEGLFYPETMYFWGTYANKNYGWKREGKPASYVENTYIRNYYSGALELLLMMIDYQDYTQDKAFRSQLTQMIDGVLTFYDKHYERDANNKVRFAPAQSLETWQDVVNPLPEIAGLRTVINEIIEQRIPVNKSTLAMARKLLQQLPDLPQKDQDGKPTLLAAERIFGEIKNTENPELYAVFPYRVFMTGKPDMEIGITTFQNRRFKKTGGWVQDAIQAAYLGLTNEAKDAVVKNFTAEPAGRFPAFWGPNYDWIPDQDHGNVAAMALQSMLVQADSNKIYLMPAWPKDWDVDFKLRAPNNTAIAGVYRGGKFEQLTTTPAKRSVDVVQMQSK